MTSSSSSFAAVVGILLVALPMVMALPSSSTLLDTIIDFSPMGEKHVSHASIMAIGPEVEALKRHIVNLEDYSVAPTRETRVAALLKLAVDHGALASKVRGLCEPVIGEHDDISRRAYQEREQLKVSEALLRDPNQDNQYIDKIEEMLARNAEKLERLENLWMRTATTVQACRALKTTVDGLEPRMSALRRTAKMDDISETSGSTPKVAPIDDDMPSPMNDEGEF